MRLKKFFAPSKNNGESDTQPNDLDFKSEPKITGPITRAMKKLLQQKEATELAINVLCDLSKKTLLQLRVGTRIFRQPITF